MREHGILRIVARLLIPLIMLFGLYIQFHGDYSPGGGFQAGVVFASAWILFVLIYGLDDALKVIPERAMFVLMLLGVLLYAAVGIAGVLLGGHFLNFYPLLPGKHAAQQFGIITVELGVGVTVATVMMLIFTQFARRRQLLAEVNEEVD
ncbi:MULTISPECIES: Na(+)/H(+) antiporter subunit B [unclassified Wenzhouxiangella]|uniref:Na(+)/H(+) antiporter subunit B n=1 Tax=unclassified Wenzhouxiangella TaxID=2613841 RepID=UPI000E325429|nr:MULTISPECIES: Na(+)/H(+) antiporter subunit B [unclassified Wenzhouxiangella]RFF28395.1 Na(+)/H(+) antiporter subunit B [Wenzhouxiangella sp. 15181]RFP69912.1 Na(+)/H(+) antiporter subunit B [Wenzhouxiangella sp. 15190]